MSRTFNVAVVGATGAVGEVMLEILAERNFPVGEVFPLASERSAGKRVSFGKKQLRVQNLAEFDFSKTQIGLFSAGASISKVYAPKAAQAIRAAGGRAEARGADTPPLIASNQQHLGAHLGHRKQFGDVLIIKPDTAVRRLAANLARVVRAVDAVILPAEVQGMCAQRIVGTRRNIGRPFRVPLAHVRGRAPIGSVHLAHYAGTTTARQILGQRHARREQTIGDPVLVPVMQRPRGDIHKDRPIVQIAEVRLPL